MSDSIEKIKKNRRRTLLKKELLAAGIAALVSLPGKGEAKTASAPEARIEAYALPEESMEPAAEFPLDGVSDADYNDGNFEYDRRLSRGLSVKYTGAYVDYETRDVIYKAADPHDKDYRSTIDACLESQKLGVGVYDRSQDRNYIHNEMVASTPNQEHYVYNRKLSRGLSIKYSGAYVDIRTGDVILKAASRYDRDEQTTYRSCTSSQKLKTGAYDRSRDREIRRDMVRDGEYNGGTVIRDVVHGIGHILRSRRSR